MSFRPTSTPDGQIAVAEEAEMLQNSATKGAIMAVDLIPTALYVEEMPCTMRFCKGALE